MQAIYSSQIRFARNLNTAAEGLSYLSSILRSILQVVALTALETTIKATPTIDDDLNIKQMLDRFQQPSDGLPIEILDTLIPRIRSLVFPQYMRGWYETECKHSNNLVNTLIDWVNFRNKRPAHGVLDEPTTMLWKEKTAELIERVLSVSFESLPRQTSSGLISQVGDATIPLSLPLAVEKSAIVVTRVVSKNGLWKIHAQLLSWLDARELLIDLPPNNLFTLDKDLPERFKWLDVPWGGGFVTIFNNLPIRQTSTFVGRKKELDKLSEWLNDSDSRSCLVYGDGGFGKTTLVLEFFNHLIENGVDADQKPPPSIISFYTSKKTKWTEEGLIHFKGISDAMEDSIRELVYCITPILGKEWYKIEGKPLIDKVATVLSNEGFTRDDILIIIDNSETLATSTADAEELADFISQAARKIGRIVITSRRREHLAAFPILVSKLTEVEALKLIKKLGENYGANAINQSSEPKLRRACEQLMYKPLLIDTLVRYIARSSSGLQEGLDQILRKTNDDLLEFLYEDAWLRMTALVQEVFIVLASLATPLDSKSIGETCQRIGVLHSEFQSSLGETYFASLIDHGDSYDLEIVELAKEFFRNKKRRLSSDDKERMERIALEIERLATDRHKTIQAYKIDRVADAFRSDYAKAAKVAAINRNYKQAIENYELALLEEPLNAALHERYSSFLLRSLGQAAEALPYSLRASELDPQSADAWLTMGLIRYQLADLVNGDTAIDNARALGKQESLCLLRKAIARYHIAKSDPYSKRALPLLKEALTFIELSRRTSAKRDDPYHAKNRREGEKYMPMIRFLVEKISRREAT